jgi:hypothetical protein
MHTFRLILLKHEAETWQRLTGFMAEENNLLKLHLAEVVGLSDDKELVTAMETYHQRLLTQDVVLEQLRIDNTRLQKLLVQEIFEDGQLEYTVYKQLRTVRKDIRRVEQLFSELKFGFNQFLTDRYGDVNTPY